MRNMTARLMITLALLAGFLTAASSTFATVTITGASGGGNISADTAADGIAPAWTTLGAITITEGASTDFTNGTGVTLVLKAPAGLQFNPAVTPSVTYTASKNINSASAAITSSNITVRLTVAGTAVGNDSLIIGSTTGIQVRPTADLPLATGNHIYRPSSGGGTAGIRGITNSTDGSAGSNFGTLTEAPGTPSATMPTQAQIMGDMVLANDYFMNKWPAAGCSSCLTGSRPSTIWTRATYFEGALALWRVNHDPAITNYATQWGTFHNWILRNGAIDTSADNQCAGSEYIELYQLDTTKASRITNIVANLNYWMFTNSSKIDWWWYIDGVHMSMPAFAKMATISGSTNLNYSSKMYSYWNYTKNTLAPSNGLYNKIDHLWCRDSNYLANYKASDGTTQKCYWSRGNGWVFAGLARAMDVLSTNDPHFTDEYLKTFKEMAAAIKAVQRSDGFWNMNLGYTNDYPGPESSGTAMFTYGLAWGIHHGYLDSATYLPTVIKGWNALTTSALHHSPSSDPGFIGFVQSTGSYPTNTSVVTYTSVPDFDDYTLGALLLAGSELYQIASLSQTITFDALPGRTFGDAPFALSASASSGLPVSFSIVGPATLAGNVLTITGAGSVTVTASQAGNGSYSAATDVTQSFTVQPAVLGVTADNKNAVYGAGIPALTASYTGFVYNDTAAVLSGSPSLTTTATALSPAGSYPITAATGSLSAANYSFTFGDGNLTISPQPLIITANPAGKTYGDIEPALTYQLTGTLVGSDSLSGSLSRQPGENSGSYAIGQGNLAANANYNLTFVGASFTIAPRPLTVTADTAGKAYGDSDPALTYHLSGTLVGGDGLSGSLSRESGDNAGSYAIGQGSLAASANYALTFVGASFTIAPRALVAQANDQSRAYGATNPILTISYSGFVGSDGLSNLMVLPEATTDAVTNSPVGPYAITLTGGSDTNYSLVLSNGTLTVKTAALTVKADDQSRAYGAADPSWTASYSGFVNGDDSSVLSGTLAFATTAATASPVGTYDITPSGLNSTNYAITYQAGTLTVTQAALTLTADPQSKTYGDAEPALTYHITGTLVGSDSLIGSLSRESGENAGSYAIGQGSLAATANYILTFVGADFTITPVQTANMLVSSQNPSQYGSNVTLTATVTPVSPAVVPPLGTVQFFINGVASGSPLALAAGVASISTSSLPAGTNSIEAVYLGDGNFLGSTCSMSQVVSVPAEVPIVLGITANKDGTVTARFQGSAGAQYVVEATDTLTLPSWQSISTNNASSSDGIWSVITSTAGHPQRFFRAAKP